MERAATVGAFAADTTARAPPKNGDAMSLLGLRLLLFLAAARRSVFLRRAARFFAFVLPWLCP